MALGFRVGDGCYATSAEALDVYYSSILPTFRHDGSTVYSVFVYSDAGVWKVHAQLNQGTYQNITLYPVPVVVPVSCEMGAAADYDYVVLGQIWAFAFSIVLLTYLLAKGAGTLIEFVRKN